jgi:hypothetical protein
MRNIIDTLIAGTIVAMLVLPAGAPASGSDNQQAASSRSLKLGLGVEIDSDWIRLNGSWSVVSATVRDEGSNRRVHELPIGAVPNLLGRAKKGAALVRTIRTTTLCVVKHFVENRQDTVSNKG